MVWTQPARIPPANMQIAPSMEDNDSSLIPVIPCPQVQPPANRDPIIVSAAPMKLAVAEYPTGGEYPGVNVQHSHAPTLIAT